jgi:hypothetical protein
MPATRFSPAGTASSAPESGSARWSVDQQGGRRLEKRAFMGLMGIVAMFSKKETDTKRVPGATPGDVN